MIMLLAHHLEPHHVGIAIGLFTAGTIAGWAGCSRWLSARARDQHTA
jgi:hypothetical protein